MKENSTDQYYADKDLVGFGEVAADAIRYEPSILEALIIAVHQKQRDKKVKEVTASPKIDRDGNVTISAHGKRK